MLLSRGGVAIPNNGSIVSEFRTKFAPLRSDGFSVA
jgi:hypothetical protein